MLLRILALVQIFLLEKISVYAPNSVTQALANVRLQQFRDLQSPRKRMEDHVGHFITKTESGPHSLDQSIGVWFCLFYASLFYELFVDVDSKAKGFSGDREAS